MSIAAVVVMSLDTCYVVRDCLSGIPEILIDTVEYWLCEVKNMQSVWYPSLFLLLLF